MLANDALVEVTDTTNEPNSRAEAMSLVNNVHFQFLVTLVTRYDLILRVNVVRKLMQQNDMQSGLLGRYCQNIDENNTVSQRFET